MIWNYSRQSPSTSGLPGRFLLPDDRTPARTRTGFPVTADSDVEPSDYGLSLAARQSLGVILPAAWYNGR